MTTMDQPCTKKSAMTIIAMVVVVGVCWLTMVNVTPSEPDSTSIPDSKMAIAKRLMLQRQQLLLDHMRSIQRQQAIKRTDENAQALLSGSSVVRPVALRTKSPAWSHDWLNQQSASLSEIRQKMKEKVDSGILDDIVQQDQVDPDVRNFGNVTSVHAMQGDPYQYGLDSHGRVLIVKGLAPAATDHAGDREEADDATNEIKQFLDAVYYKQYKKDREGDSLEYPSTVGHIVAASLSSANNSQVNKNPINFFLQDAVSNQRGTYSEQETVAQVLRKRLGSNCVSITITFNYEQESLVPSGGQYVLSVLNSCPILKETSLAKFLSQSQEESIDESSVDQEVQAMPLTNALRISLQRMLVREFVSRSKPASEEINGHERIISVSRPWLNSHRITAAHVTSEGIPNFMFSVNRNSIEEPPMIADPDIPVRITIIQEQRCSIEVWKQNSTPESTLSIEHRENVTCEFTGQIDNREHVIRFLLHDGFYEFKLTGRKLPNLNKLKLVCRAGTWEQIAELNYDVLSSSWIPALPYTTTVRAEFTQCGVRALLSASNLNQQIQKKEEEEKGEQKDSIIKIVINGKPMDNDFKKRQKGETFSPRYKLQTQPNVLPLSYHGEKYEITVIRSAIREIILRCKPFGTKDEQVVNSNVFPSVISTPEIEVSVKEWSRWEACSLEMVHTGGGQSPYEPWGYTKPHRLSIFSYPLRVAAQFNDVEFKVNHVRDFGSKPEKYTVILTRDN